LVSSTGHGNAAMHRVHYVSGKFALSNLLCAVMPKDKEIVNAKFLYELFMAKKDEYFVPIMAGTSNVSLNPGKLGAVEIPIPPIDEQNRIVELLEKINEIKQTHKEQEAELKQLMPSLLDKAFKGEL
jgi:type I restriction enzyme S subunit